MPKVVFKLASGNFTQYFTATRPSVACQHYNMLEIRKYTKSLSCCSISFFMKIDKKQLLMSISAKKLTPPTVGGWWHANTNFIIKNLCVSGFGTIIWEHKDQIFLSSCRARTKKYLYSFQDFPIHVKVSDLTPMNLVLYYNIRYVVYVYCILQYIQYIIYTIYYIWCVLY